jgi:hypothetical protein
MNSKYKLLLILIITSISIFFSCTNDKSVNYFAVEIIKDSDSTIARGLNMYATKAEILKVENKKSLISDDNNTIEYKYFTNEIKELSVLYYLDSEGVYQIEITSEFVNSGDATQALAEFINHLSKKYGAPEKDKDIYYWDVFAKKTSIDINAKGLSDKILVITFSFLE